MALEPNADDTWLLTGNAVEADEAPEVGPAHRSHRAPADHSSLIALGKGVTAVIGGCAAVALVVLSLDLGRSSPKSHPPSGNDQGLVAPLSSSAPASSAAPSSEPTSAKPKKSASTSPSKSASPTQSASTSAAHDVARSSPAQAVPPLPPRTSTSHSRSPSPSPSPTPATSHLTFTIPGHAFHGSITIAMPNGWTITGSSGGSRDGNTWHVFLGQLTVSVAGPRGSHKTMTATVNPALGETTVQTYQLN